jgi:hypothetical protein
MELQLRMEDAQRKLSQLDDLRNQLLRTQGGAVAELSNQTEFGHAQGGPIHRYCRSYYIANSVWQVTDFVQSGDWTNILRASL